METPIIVLAAGSSSRLGQPKQLLPRDGTSMLAYVVQECIASQLGEVIVVLGAQATRMLSEIESLNCILITNQNWQEGQGSSIACAAQSINPENVEGVFIVLVDQVHFNREVLLRINQAEKKIHLK
jgi:molybdenum cofactor cytidylyltransferase